MSFELDKFLKRNTYLLSTIEWENYMTTPVTLPKSKYLEDVGLDPARVLGEGAYKNYFYEKQRINPEPLEKLPFSPLSRLRPYRW